MKVIMLQDVGGVGQRGKIVEVSDGYALNFLIPNGKAEQATPQKEAEVVRKAIAASAQKQKEEDTLRAAIESLAHADLKVRAKASEKGGLFKAITAEDVARYILEQKNVRIPHACVQLGKPIKETGEHSIVVKKDKAVSKIRLVVVAAE